MPDPPLTLDNDTYATHPGQVRLSHARLHRLHPEMTSAGAWWRTLLLGQRPTHPVLWIRACVYIALDEHLQHGDSRAALVVRTAPLLVAAYTDELDCVALLRFPETLVSEYGLTPGSRLLTVNSYQLGRVASDLTVGPASYHRYGSFWPLIAEFLSDDQERIEERKQEIEEEEWSRTATLAETLLARPHYSVRNGLPLFSRRPGR